jgi:hypothetical protein
MNPSASEAPGLAGCARGSSSRPLSLPRGAHVEAGRDGRPLALKGVPVMNVREEWVVEDRWWTDRPLRRRYFELVLEDGRCAVVFRDLVGGRWASQRG